MPLGESAPCECWRALEKACQTRVDALDPSLAGAPPGEREPKRRPPRENAHEQLPHAGRRDRGDGLRCCR